MKKPFITTDEVLRSLRDGKQRSNYKGLELMVVGEKSQAAMFSYKTKVRGKIKARGYHVITANSSYEAIDTIAIRLHRNEALPDIFLCDMFDKEYYIAKIHIIGIDGEPRLKSICPSIIFNIYNYLESKGINPPGFIACSSYISTADIAMTQELKIPLIDIEGDKLGKLYDFFPDISELSWEQALGKYISNYKKLAALLKKQS